MNEFHSHTQSKSMFLTVQFVRLIFIVFIVTFAKICFSKLFFITTNPVLSSHSMALDKLCFVTQLTCLTVALNAFALQKHV